MDFLGCTDELGQGNLFSMSYPTIKSTVLLFFFFFLISRRLEGMQERSVFTSHGLCIRVLFV